MIRYEILQLCIALMGNNNTEQFSRLYTANV